MITSYNHTTTRVRAGLSTLALVAGLTATIAIAGAGTYLYLAQQANAEPSHDRSPAMTTVSKASFDVTTMATGELRAKNETIIKCLLESDSTIVKIVDEGILAKKGDVLIELNSDKIKTEIDEETLRVESARADLIAAENAYEIQLSENTSKTRQAQLKVDLAILEQSQWEKGDLQQKRKDLDLALEKAHRDTDRLTKKFQDSQELLKNGFLSQNEFDLDQIAMLEAKASLDKAVLAKETYEQYQFPKDQKTKQSAVDEAQAEFERTKQQNEIQRATKDADRTNRRRQLQVREEKLKKLQEQFANTKIVAPQDGLVVYATSMNSDMFWGGNGDQGPLKVGRRVFPNENLISLPDTSEMIASVRIHEAIAGRLRPGQSASVRIDAVGGKTFTGIIDSIGVLAESSWRDPNRREYPVKILLDEIDKESGLKPSMRCEATITLDRVDDALSVPVQAIFREDPVRFVYTPRDGRMVPRAGEDRPAIRNSCGNRDRP
jgi:HlyD family secretion protein